MIQSKLLNIVKTIRKEDWKAFGKFLKSPYHNSNKKVVDLYTLLSKYHPNYKDYRLTGERVFKKLFSKSKPFDQKQLANLMSHFLRQTESFLAIRQLEKKPLQQEILRGEYFEENDEYDFFKKNTLNILDQLESIEHKSSEDFFHHFWIYNRFVYHPKTPKSFGKKDHFQILLEDFSNWYTLENLRLACEAKSRAAFRPGSTPIPFLSPVKTRAAQIDLPPYNIRLMLLQLLEHKNMSDFQKITQYFFSNLNHLSRSDQLHLFNIFLNFANQAALSGEEGYFRKVFDLYKQGLKFKFSIDYEKISSAHFSNIVVTGILVKELKWVKQFIKQYETFVIEEDRFVLVNYCKARILAAEFKFDKAVDILYQIEGLKNVFAFRVRSLLTRCLYEL